MKSRCTFTRNRLPVLGILVLLLTLLTQSAGAVLITRNFTGHWDQPDQESQGIILQVVQQRDGSKDGVVYWFTYRDDGTSAWFLGVGEVQQNQLEVELLKVEGPTFLQPADPSTRNLGSEGMLMLQFSSCSDGTAVFTPNEVVGTGGFEFRVSRLTQIFNTGCSGGVSDDAPENGLASQLMQFLPNLGIAPGATAKLEFDEQADRTEFQVELEDLPAGTYALMVAGTFRGDVVVSDDGLGGTEGELEFESPLDEPKPLLDFDPRNQLVDITQGAQTFFRGVFNAAANPPEPVGSGAPEFGDNEIRFELDNTGLDADSSGDARLRQEHDRVRFDVEIEDLPPGEYELWIGGLLRGVIQVIDFGTEIEGEIEFSFPQSSGEELLDFDPRGQVVEIRQNGMVYLDGLFPQS